MSSSAVALRPATEPVMDFTFEQVAREALQKAIEDEVAEYVEAHKQHVDSPGHRLVCVTAAISPGRFSAALVPLRFISRV